MIESKYAFNISELDKITIKLNKKCIDYPIRVS